MSTTVNGLTYLRDPVPQDQFRPYPAKNEWGVDTLTRELRGSPPRMDVFVAALDQGDTYSRLGKTWHLQTWQEISDPVWPGVRLFYKSLLSGIPSPFVNNSTGTKTSTKSVIIDNATIAQSINPNAVGTEVVAIRQIEYYAPQTEYRYIRVGEPNAGTYNSLSNAATAVIRRDSITATCEGVTLPYGNSAPSAIVTALHMTSSARRIAHSSSRIIGTSWWECLDVVAIEYDGD